MDAARLREIVDAAKRLNCAAGGQDVFYLRVLAEKGADAMIGLAEVVAVLQGKLEGVELPTKELKEIEERIGLTTPACIGDLRDDARSLLSMIRFLQGMINDLKEESSAYQRGVKDGREQAALEIMETRKKAITDMAVKLSEERTAL